MTIEDYEDGKRPSEFEAMNSNYEHVDDEGYILEKTGTAEIDDYIPSPFQRMFVKYYLANGGNGDKAARQAGSQSKTPRQVAYNTLQIPWVRHQIEMGRARAANKANLSPDEIIDGLRETILEAREANKYDAAIRGYQLLGTQLGMFVQKTENTTTRRVISEGTEQHDKLQKLQSILENSPSKHITADTDIESTQ